MASGKVSTWHGASICIRTNKQSKSLDIYVVSNFGICMEFET